MYHVTYVTINQR